MSGRGGRGGGGPPCPRPRCALSVTSLSRFPGPAVWVRTGRSVLGPCSVVSFPGDMQTPCGRGVGGRRQDVALRLPPPPAAASRWPLPHPVPTDQGAGRRRGSHAQPLTRGRGRGAARPAGAPGPSLGLDGGRRAWAGGWRPRPPSGVPPLRPGAPPGGCLALLPDVRRLPAEKKIHLRYGHLRCL